MSNMSYCRFRNTFADLQDCYDHIEGTPDMDGDEETARTRLIALCVRISKEVDLDE